MRFISLIGFLILGVAGCSKAPHSEDTAALEGEWAVVRMEDQSRASTDQEMKGMRWSIKGSEITGTNPDGSSARMSLQIDSTKSPATIDLTALDGNRTGETELGIYSLEAGRLRICFANPHTTRPNELRIGPQSWIIELEKIKR